MNRKTFIILSLVLVLSSFCANASPVEVHAIASTALPPAKSDVMDDPTIWINQSNPSKSLIIGTNKRPPLGGLYIYTLEGHLKEMIPAGPLNNADIRSGFPFKKDKIDLIVASQTQEKKLVFFQVEPSQGHVRLLGFSSISFPKTPYGLCLMQRGQNLYAIVTFAEGGIEKWQIQERKGKIDAKKVSSYPIQTKAEGCASKDQDGSLFIAEEDKGIWVFTENSPPYLVAHIGENGLEADIEGLALYQNKYLIASSQGNNTYGVFSAHPPYSYLGSFKITPSPTQEGTEGTDGIDVTAMNLKGHNTQGLFVAHDNRLSKGGGSNFKLIPWSHIAQKLRLEQE